MIMSRPFCRVFLFCTILLLVLVASLVPCLAQGNDDILGVWNNQEGTSRIEIFNCEGKYCGKIVWLKEPNYLAGSKDGTPGTPKLDHRNPDPALRKVPEMGLQVIQGFEYAGGHQWKNGKIYDPKNGKTYSAKITLISPTQLDLRGFVGVSLFGRTAKWTKAE